MGRYAALFIQRQRPLRMVELSPRGKVLLDLFAEADRRSGAAAGVPMSLVRPLAPSLARSFREMALVLPSVLASTRKQIALGNFDWTFFRSWAVGIFFGVLIGTALVPFGCQRLVGRSIVLEDRTEMGVVDFGRVRDPAPWQRPRRLLLLGRPIQKHGWRAGLPPACLVALDPQDHQIATRLRPVF